MSNFSAPLDTPGVKSRSSAASDEGAIDCIIFWALLASPIFAVPPSFAEISSFPVSASFPKILPSMALNATGSLSTVHLFASFISTLFASVPVLTFQVALSIDRQSSLSTSSPKPILAIVLIELTHFLPKSLLPRVMFIAPSRLRGFSSASAFSFRDKRIVALKSEFTSRIFPIRLLSYSRVT